MEDYKEDKYYVEFNERFSILNTKEIFEDQDLKIDKWKYVLSLLLSIFIWFLIFRLSGYLVKEIYTIAVKSYIILTSKNIVSTGFMLIYLSFMVFFFILLSSSVINNPSIKFKNNNKVLKTVEWRDCNNIENIRKKLKIYNQKRFVK